MQNKVFFFFGISDAPRKTPWMVLVHIPTLGVIEDCFRVLCRPASFPFLFSFFFNCPMLMFLCIVLHELLLNLIKIML